ncbi:MAG TPA: transglutaminase-like domain-containing protein, partial [Acidimicrobiales bacterium]|nr:transglutaminase-like domain-containing protein [Acidimicrobiales bacterium]
MITPWMALVLLDAVTVASFARCFSGAGELAILVPVCIGAHLLAHLGRHLRRDGKALGGVALWMLALVLVAYVPIALIDGASFRFGLLPLTATQHVLGHQLSAGWVIFSNRIAPVVQAPGLVLAAAWAAGVLALAAEALDADTTLPAIVALVPAFDIVVFTGTLGTSTGRAPELAALAALAVWYLSGPSRLHAGEQVVTARVEGSRPQPAHDARRWSGRWSGRRAPSAVAGLALVAGVSAGVIGPLVPGATSSALLAWHHGGKPSGMNKGGPPGGGVGPVTISNLVNVAEEEIDNANVPLFRVYGSSPTSEILFVDDFFNGSQFVEQPSRAQRPVRPFPASLEALEAHPPTPVLGTDEGRYTQVICNIDLEGPAIPVPGLMDLRIDGDALATFHGTDGPITVAPEAFGNSYCYGVQAERTPPPDVAQEYYDRNAPPATGADLELPAGVPAKIQNQAHSLVTSQMNEDEKATAIQNFFLDNFRYYLPKSVPPTQPSGFAALENFLFTTRTGYCQQFASAFAVLARIDGLPTRVVVGFEPTPESHGSWVVTGTQTHAWPQVYFPGTGWVDFEPTPGAGAPTYPNIATTTTRVAVTTTTLHSATRSYLPAHNLHPAKGDVTPSSFVFPTVPRTPSGPAGGTSQGGGSGDVTSVLLALVAGALVWAVVIPSWRMMRDRRRRDPARRVLLAWREAVSVLAAAGFHRRR